MTASKSRIKGLKALGTELNTTHQRLATIHRKEIAEKTLALQKKDKHLAREKRLFPRKLEIAKQVFEWGKAFAATKEYAELQSLRGQDLFFDTSLQLYSGKWGHGVPEYHYGDIGCWSRFFLKEDQTFTYSFGYKWMGSNWKQIFRTPQALAADLNYNYLKDLRESLYSGEAIKKVISSLKRE